MKELIEKNNDLLAQSKVLKDQLQVKHVVIDTHVEYQEKYAKLEAERYEYMIRYSAYFDNDKQHRKQIDDQKVLFDKMSFQMVELDKHVRDLKNTVLEKDFKISELEECVRNKDLEIEKCLERLNFCENKLNKIGQTNLTVHMIMPSKDNLYNGRKEIINPDFEKIDSPFQQTSSLKPYVSNVILEKIIIDFEDEVINILEKEKVNLEIIKSLKSKGVESSEKVCFELENQSENDRLVVEKECDKVENPKVIAPGMFKLNVSQCVSPISMSTSSCDSNNVEIKLKSKRRKRKSSKQNVKQVDNDVPRANSYFVHFLDLDTFSSVRRPKHSSVVGKKKGSSNTSNVGLSVNTDADAAFDDKENESEVHVSPSSSAKPKKHDEKGKREAKGKSPIDLSTGVRDLSNEFEEFFGNSTNKVNAVSIPVTTVGPNSTNSTNNFNVVGPSDNAVSPNFEIGGKYSFMDPSQYPNDPNMPALEDNIYSDDKEDTRSMTRMVKEQGGLTQINDEDFHTCMFACFLSQEEPKRVHQALKDLSWIEAMQEKLLQFKMQKVWEEGIDYEEVFAPVARIEVIRLFLAYASFMGFMVYQMDVKSAFLYGTIEEEVYVCQPPGFEDPDYPDKFTKWSKHSMGCIKLLELDGKSASTPIDTEKPLLKNPDSKDVDVHIYRSMIGSLIYLTLSRPDIMFVVCACARFQVSPKVSHLHTIKRIFRYLKGKPHLGLWYSKDSLFNLMAYSDSDYAGASLDRKSTIGGCHFLGYRLISWQCKKQTVVATSSTESDANEGFDQIVNFLNAHMIQYALMVNPTIYVLCIKQFWTSVSIKKSNDIVRLQALIDWKKVIITEDTIRQALRLDYAAGVDFLPNEEIFVELARM
nr:uncharacterized mitochondrial protein AtMg00810-like [Tanacetum cinerariifolium]